jgi:chorismate dehydratase
MLLEDRYGVRPTYTTMPPELGPMLREADAAVLIGDPALRASHEAAARGLHLTDLGAAWREWSGLPMVFAVWAARRDYAQSHPQQVADVHAAFLRSRTLALGQLDAVAEHASRYEDLTAADLAHYFRTLDFSLGPRQLAGLREFARRAALRGAVPSRPTIRVLDVPDAMDTPA